MAALPPSASVAKAGAAWWGYQQPAPARILIVDDDETVRKVSAIVMAQWGFDVDTADDGETGWKALCGSNYDLVITDNDMPRLTGLELIKRMRAVSSNLPCILVSGRPPEPEKILAEIIQPGAFLPKPFQPAELMAKAERLLLAKMESMLNEIRPSAPV